jgi:hypothetical protein
MLHVPRAGREVRECRSACSFSRRRAQRRATNPATGAREPVRKRRLNRVPNRRPQRVNHERTLAAVCVSTAVFEETVASAPQKAPREHRKVSVQVVRLP